MGDPTSAEIADQMRNLLYEIVRSPHVPPDQLGRAVLLVAEYDTAIDREAHQFATGDPWSHHDEYGDSCAHCGATSGRPTEHLHTCRWMLARELRGIGVDAAHDFEELGPPTPPLIGPWIPPEGSGYHFVGERWTNKAWTVLDMLPTITAPRGGIWFIPPPTLE